MLARMKKLVEELSRASEAYYKYDKPIIVISASLNIVISVFLANQLGINGVLIGTTITSLIYLF